MNIVAPNKHINGLKGKCFEIPNDSYTNTLCGIQKKPPHGQAHLVFAYVKKHNIGLILVKTDELGIPERTTNKILKRFLNSNSIVKVSRGVYAAKR